MADVICEVCDTANTNGETLCGGCGVLLAEHDARTRKLPVGGVEEPARVPAVCPACRAPIPDPANGFCVDCLEPLTPRVVPATDATGLRLVFAGQPIAVAGPGWVLLGRDARESPVASVFATQDHVSRRHASVGVEPDGTAWVRDEHSTNGTFVNNQRVPGGTRVPLAHGDQLRLASNIVTQVELGR